MRFVGGLLRRRYVFNLSPARNLKLADGVSDTWVANGPDPQFLLVSNNNRYPRGWILLESSLIRKSSDKTAKLYFDLGQGFQDGHSLFVPVSRRGSIKEVLRLPPGIKALRWDPMESPGELCQKPLVFIEITRLERMTRMARRVIPLWKKHPELRPSLRRPIGQARTGILKQAYAFAGRLRNDAKLLAAAGLQEANPTQKTTIQYLRPNQLRLCDPIPDLPENKRHLLRIDIFNSHSLAGWVIDKEMPDQPVLLDLYINEVHIARTRADLVRQDVAAQGRGSAYCGFLFTIPKRFQVADTLKARLCLTDSSAAIDGLDYLYTPRDVLIRGLLSAVESLNHVGRSPDRKYISPSLPATEMSVLLARQVLWPMLVEHLRKTYQQADGLFARLPNVLAIPQITGLLEEKIDIVVPAYKGIEETIACIRSVLTAKGSTPYELIVINDCSPEPQLSEKLKELSLSGNFSLIENQTNFGFVRSANLGMMQHETRDVVLLNSDTEVSDGWLDRLRSAAYSETNIATATPFSNRATICSFPLSNQDNDLPTGMSLPEVDAAFSRANSGRIADLPTAVGFCMYIRREALLETGYFDEQLWDKGYGEENDFCLRASVLGWRHVIACDVFVRHHGSVSFSADSGSRSAKNMETMHRLYPDYHHTVMRFIQTDPLAYDRLQAFVECAKSYSSRYVLFITHSLGGGADFAAIELSKRLMSEKQSVLTLIALPDDTVKLTVFGTNLSAIYKGSSRYARLKDDLRHLNVWLIQVHQLLGYSHDIYNMIESSGAPFDVTLHDYYCICPRVNLIDASESYCGEPDEAGCRKCLEDSGTHESCRTIYQQLGSNIFAWRKHHLNFFKKARCLIAPSFDVKHRIEKYYRDLNIVVRPHPEPTATIRPRSASYSQNLSIAFIGAIGVHKGFNVIMACAEDAQKRHLPIRYIVVGYTCNDSMLKNYANVVITGKYQHPQLENFLSQHNCAVAAFFSVCPETYSYTLSEAWALGLFPVTFNIGAPAERIKNNGYGLTIPFPSDPSTINDTLLNIGKALGQHKPENPIGTCYSNIMVDYYGFSEN